MVIKQCTHVKLLLSKIFYYKSYKMQNQNTSTRCIFHVSAKCLQSSFRLHLSSQTLKVKLDQVNFITIFICLNQLARWHETKFRNKINVKFIKQNITCLNTAVPSSFWNCATINLKDENETCWYETVQWLIQKWN